MSAASVAERVADYRNAAHDARRAAERTPRPAPLLLLAALVASLAVYLFVLSRRSSPLAPAGILFIGAFVHELVSFVVEEVGRG